MTSITLSLEDFLAGMSDAPRDAATAIKAEIVINSGSMNKGITGVPSAFNANVVKE